jgi:type VI secretion system protein ImpJ
MKNLRRVVWSKGMFLTPQHFQSQDEYFEDSLQFRFTGSNFANWGLLTLGPTRRAWRMASFGCAIAEAFCRMACCSTCLNRTIYRKAVR